MAVGQPSPQADRQDADVTVDAPEPHDALAEVQARAREMEDRWRRAAADLDNYRKRVAGDLAAQQEQERARVAAQWLPVLDNLELALDHAGADPDAIIDGVRAIRDQAVEVLGRLGFPRRDDVGRSFDPAVHEAVATVADPDAAPGTVVRVVRPGYGDDDRLLRPAAVVVAAKTRPRTE